MSASEVLPFPALVRNVVAPVEPPTHLHGLNTFVDMFCGIGGFHLAATTLGMKCVFACDVDEEARKAYKHNFGIQPAGDISRIKASRFPTTTSSVLVSRVSHSPSLASGRVRRYPR